MILPEKLRIGNWITTTGGFHTKITSLQADKKISGKPTVLNQIYLLGYNFQIKLGKSNVWIHQAANFEIIEKKVGTYFQLCNNREIGIAINYIHELQNRFFSFTGKELVN